MKPAIFAILIGLFAFSCESQNDYSIRKAEDPASSEAKVSQADDSDAPNNKIIKTANIKFQVNNVDQSTANIQNMLTIHEAYLAEMNLETNPTDITNRFVIRVRSQHFDTLLKDLENESVFVNYRKIVTDDVTEEFVDLESRLKTKKEVVARYEDILRTKSKTVEDVLNAEEQIRVLQEEIEAKEGRLRFLQSKVSYSTINLDIYQKVEYKEIPDTFQKPYAQKAKHGFLNGWTIITNFVLALINIWPFVIVGAAVYWKRRWLRDRLLKRKG